MMTHAGGEPGGPPAAGGRGPGTAPSSTVSRMNDDWRLRIELHEHGFAHTLGEQLAGGELEHDLARAFKDRAVVSVEGSEVFCYTGTRDQAERAEKLIHEIAGREGWEVEIELRHWHPTAEEWEDPDAPLPKPFVHWIAFNIGPDVTGLAEGITRDDNAILLQGKNSGLRTGWTGMAPPKGDTQHHYHFQVFALDQKLELQGGAGRSALINAMANHVLARGELVGTFRR